MTSLEEGIDMAEPTDTNQSGWFGHIMSLTGMGALTLARTVLGIFGLGVLIAVLCGFLSANGSLARALIVGALAAAVCVVVALPLGFHRAVTRTLVESARRLHVARTVISAAFDQILGVNESGAHAQRGTAAARAIESLTIAQAQDQVQGALKATLKDSPDATGIRGAIMRRVRARLGKELGRITLLQFRQSVAPTGKVDLIRVRDALVMQADQMLESHLLGVSRKLLTLVVIGLCVVLPLVAYALRHVPLCN